MERIKTRNRGETRHVFDFFKITWVKAPYLICAQCRCCAGAAVTVRGVLQVKLGSADVDMQQERLGAELFSASASAPSMAICHRNGKWSRNSRESLHLWKMLWDLYFSHGWEEDGLGGFLASPFYPKYGETERSLIGFETDDLKKSGIFSPLGSPLPYFMP